VDSKSQTKVLATPGTIQTFRIPLGIFLGDGLKATILPGGLYAQIFLGHRNDPKGLALLEKSRFFKRSWIGGVGRLHEHVEDVFASLAAEAKAALGIDRRPHVVGKGKPAQITASGGGAHF
jgi:hypothetical protein